MGRERAWVTSNAGLEMHCWQQHADAQRPKALERRLQGPERARMRAEEGSVSAAVTEGQSQLAQNSHMEGRGGDDTAVPGMGGKALWASTSRGRRTKESASAKFAAGRWDGSSGL